MLVWTNVMDRAWLARFKGGEEQLTHNLTYLECIEQEFVALRSTCGLGLGLGDIARRA